MKGHAGNQFFAHINYLGIVEIVGALQQDIVLGTENQLDFLVPG